MSIRGAAITWYQSVYKKLDKPLYTSKMYRPEESWTKNEVWFFQVPIDIIKTNQIIHLLCQKRPDSKNFYHLSVDAAFMRSHMEKFAKINDKVALYLSPHSTPKFIELRGTGRLNFGQFLIK